MQVWTPPKQRYQVPKVRPVAPASTRLPQVTQTQLNITFFLLYGSLFLFMILAVSYRKYRKKNWLLKNYYFSKLIWPCRSIGQQRSDDPKHQQ